jgi:hypothetical protein
VIISLDGKPWAQVPPADCAQLGFQAIESAIEAERDAGLFGYLSNVVFGKDDAAAAARVLAGLRDYREQHRVEGLTLGRNMDVHGGDE